MLYYLFPEKEASLPEELTAVVELLNELDPLYIENDAAKTGQKITELKEAITNIASVEDLFACCLIANANLTGTPMEAALNRAIMEKLTKKALTVAEMVFFLDRYWLPASTHSIIYDNLRQFIGSVSPDDTKAMEDFQWLLCIVAHDVVTDAKTRFNLSGMIHKKVLMLERIDRSRRTSNQP